MGGGGEAKREPGATCIRAESGIGAKAPGRRRLRSALLGLIALLFVLSVPWYRETGARVGIVFGLPDWVAVALGCYIAVAFCNALAWLLAEVPEDDPLELPPDPPPSGEGAQ